MWWKNAVAYQIYPRSFYDSNADGIGDLQGIIQKLDYLCDLGIDLLWICPIYASPNHDNGYDIQDYQSIMVDFGTMDDFDELLAQCHQKGLKLIIDLVINHTSDEHAWFMASRRDKNDPKRDWYIWCDSKDYQYIEPKTGQSYPNNWESIFGGSAWEYDEKTDASYLHLFSKHQPDLNWENEQMRNALYTMIRWWLDKGVDGFRVDAISHIKKKAGLPNLPNPKQYSFVPSYAYHMNVEGIESYLMALRDQTFSHYDIVTVGEANGVTAEQSGIWVDEKTGAFDMIFQFEHLDLWRDEYTQKVNLIELKSTLSKWQTALEGNGWNALYIENHDQPRAVSTWGDANNHWHESATCLAMMYFFMKGTPFIYQGQELGMTNAPFASLEEYRDISSHNLYAKQLAEGIKPEEILACLAAISRDHSRTPMQWNNQLYAGFSTVKPWININPNYLQINVKAQQNDPMSIYHFYKKMIQLRKTMTVLRDGVYQLLYANHPQLFVYTRTDKALRVVMVANMSTEIVHLNDIQLPMIDNMLLTNTDTYQAKKSPTCLKAIAPYHAYLYLTK